MPRLASLGAATSNSRLRIDSLILLVPLCFGNAACHSKATEQPPFRIIATDSGFEAPDAVPAGLRHIVFENHGSEIHESMLVKLAPGMSAADYSRRSGAARFFPLARGDYSGPGLTSPGDTVEVWTKADPGNYVLICWNDSHARTTPVHPFVVQETILNDEVAPEDLILKLIDYRFELSGKLRKGSRRSDRNPGAVHASLLRVGPHCDCAR